MLFKRLHKTLVAILQNGLPLGSINYFKNICKQNLLIIIYNQLSIYTNNHRYQVELNRKDIETSEL